MLDTAGTMRNKVTPLISLILVVGLALIAPCRAAPDDTTPGVPSVAFFPLLPFDAPPDIAPELIPVSSSLSMSGDHKGIKRAIILIHDYARDTARGLADMTALVGPDNRDTLVLAPLFLLETDIPRFADHLPDAGKNFARWPLGGWSQGGDSVSLTQRNGISSFTAVDLLLLYLGDRASFPDLETIAVAGHGEGGDFVERYAAAGRAVGLTEEQNIQVRFVVANPSSYLYFTAARFQGGKQGFGLPNPQQCVGYNSWPYGLDNLAMYGRRVGTTAIKQNYSQRRIAFIVGADLQRDDPAPDASCAAGLQGKERIVRQSIYQMYLNIIFGDALAHLEDFVVVPQVGYDAAALFGSRCALSLLLGDGTCAGSDHPN